MTLSLGTGLLATQAQARTAPERPAAQAQSVPQSQAQDQDPGKAQAPPQSSAVTQDGDEPEHVGKDPLKPRQRAPLSASKDELKRDYDGPATSAQRARPSMKAAGKGGARADAAAAACSTADFTGRTGSALVAQIRASTTDCVNTLFSLTGSDAYHAFREAQMATVAYAMRDGSSAYPGNSSTGMPQLVLYLRAGYYVHWYNESAVGPYGQSLKTAIRSGLDAFFASGHAFDVSDANGETLAEAVTLIDSAEENARYLHVVKRLLNGYNSSYDASWWMLNAVNSVYTVLFRGHQVPEFVSAVTADRSVLTTLYDFASAHTGLLGTDRGYLTSNAGRELGRFLQHSALRPDVRPKGAGLLGRSSMTGRTAPLWVGFAEMADFYDKANCGYYGTCNLQERLAAAVLPINHTCSGSLRIRAQEMTAAQLGASCSSLAGQDAYFHGIARDGGPVAGDRNTTLEVVAFDSSTDYQTYAGAMFGIDTNNGGMYLEGDPSAAGNQPRFIAYEAEWVRPAFEIWNLNHEYTHYLDGRFNMHGDFTANVSTPTIWWIEGFAEYVSYSYRNLRYDAAITEAGRRTYALSTLFNTTYSHDQTRVYRWGYLAVRYMLQSHRSETDTVLGYYRGGNWSAARSYLTGSIGSRHDADWYTWLGACAAGECGGGGGGGGITECAGTDTRQMDRNCKRSGIAATAGGHAYFYLYVPAGTAQLKITASGGTGNADLYYNSSTWATTGGYTSRSTGPGNSETLTVGNPAAGYHYISLAAAADFGGATLTTEY
ncbi:M9 family metallopeptidase [Streptomyces sp. 184]